MQIREDIEYHAACRVDSRDRCRILVPRLSSRSAAGPALLEIARDDAPQRQSNLEQGYRSVIGARGASQAAPRTTSSTRSRRREPRGNSQSIDWPVESPNSADPTGARTDIRPPPCPFHRGTPASRCAVRRWFGQDTGPGSTSLRHRQAPRLQAARRRGRAPLRVCRIRAA